MFDIFIKNGTVVDGTGKPGYQADIGIVGDRITYIGNAQESSQENVQGNTQNSAQEQAAAKIIDARGKTVTPGFIDPHTHVDLTVLEESAMEPYLKQGITTVVTGNCGYSIAPQGQETLYYSAQDCAFLEEAGAGESDMNPLIFHREKGAAALKHRYDIDLDWQTFSEFQAKCETLPLGCNMAPLLGHSAVRTAVMGMNCLREATETEISAMEEEVRLAMKAGAFGMSTGRDPLYRPGPNATDEEIHHLLKIVADCGGVFSSHTYNYNKAGEPDRIGGYEEMIRQAEGLALKLNISHVHVMGMAENSEEAVTAAEETLAYFDKIRAGGVDLTYDIIPSPTCADFTQVSFGYFIKPLVKLAGTREKLAERFKEPEFCAQVHDMIERGMLPALDENDESGWLTEFSILKHSNSANKGRRLVEIADEMGLAPADAMMKLFAEDPDMAADIISPDFGEAVDLLCGTPYAMPCSDGSSYAKETNLTGDDEIPLYPNSMNIGYIPRYLNRYGKGAGVGFTGDGSGAPGRIAGFEEAVRKASGFVAERFDIAERGVIREGNFADLVILDRERLRSFDEDENPLRDPEGIEYVFVNGQPAVAEERFISSGAGRVLRKGER